MIKAPFNFVPLSENVFFPEWASQVSHDVPFEDGLSGTINLTITAETPLFIRNGQSKAIKQGVEVVDNNGIFGVVDSVSGQSVIVRTQHGLKNYVGNDLRVVPDSAFSQTPDGRYFIPSTSLKGAIRSVLEIISFGKMSHVDNKRYSIRDLASGSKYLQTFQNNTIHCGWMTLTESVVHITDNGEPLRISIADIDEHYGTNLDAFIHNSSNFSDEEKRSPLYKIKMFSGKDCHTYFHLKGTNKNNPKDTRKKVYFAKHSMQDAIAGTIVFTGQPGVRKDGDKKYNRKPSGKYYEFVFPDKEVSNPYVFDIESELWHDFTFIYKDSKEWAYWKKKLDKGEKVPVFFIKDGDELSFGLSYLYKLPFKKKVKDYLPDAHRSLKLDLAECMFGTVGDKEQDSLKGRVSFSHAFCTECHEMSYPTEAYMGSPRPTYYPMYIRQKGSGGEVYKIYGGQKAKPNFTTMLDEAAQLSGFKRYPVKENASDYIDIPEGQEKNSSQFMPLDRDSQFQCKVLFFNLKRIELAALLKALQLPKGAYHSLGFAKPYGYGRIRIDVSDIDGCMLDVETLKKEFDAFMETRIPNYLKSEQLKEFNAMSRLQDLRPGFSLSYMQLNDFVKSKNEGEYLQPYSQYIQRKSSSEVVKSKEVIATVALSSNKKVKLDGQSVTYDLEFPFGSKPKKLKGGEKIKVTINYKNGKISSVTFIDKC